VIWRSGDLKDSGMFCPSPECRCKQLSGCRYPECCASATPSRSHSAPLHAESISTRRLCTAGNSASRRRPRGQRIPLPCRAAGSLSCDHRCEQRLVAYCWPPKQVTALPCCGQSGRATAGTCPLLFSRPDCHWHDIAMACFQGGDNHRVRSGHAPRTRPALWFLANQSSLT
jgi:hypothetical protein